MTTVPPKSICASYHSLLVVLNSSYKYMYFSFAEAATAIILLRVSLGSNLLTYVLRRPNHHSENQPDVITPLPNRFPKSCIYVRCPSMSCPGPYLFHRRPGPLFLSSCSCSSNAIYRVCFLYPAFLSTRMEYDTAQACLERLGPTSPIFESLTNKTKRPDWYVSPFMRFSSLCIHVV